MVVTNIRCRGRQYNPVLSKCLANYCRTAFDSSGSAETESSHPHRGRDTQTAPNSCHFHLRRELTAYVPALARLRMK